MKQKIIAVGNSAAVTIPKDFLDEADIEIGDQVFVETNLEDGSVLIKTEKGKSKVKLSQDLESWAKDFIKKYQPALKQLAKK